MKTFDSPQATTLYYIALGNSVPMINHEQRTAIATLIANAGNGDMDAYKALKILDKRPSLHPFLKEMIREYWK